MEPDAKRPKVEDAEDACSATEVLSLQWGEPDIPTQLCDVHDDIRPPFAHAFFGLEERIHGYRQLKVTLTVDIYSFYSLLDIQYAWKREDADDIRQILEDKFEYPFAGSPEMLHQQCQKFWKSGLSIGDFGEEVVRQSPFLDGELVVSHIRLSEADEKVKGLHYRLEPFLMFFIDGFQCIDTSDPDWTLFSAVFVKEKKHRLVGYTTVYRCYAYPDGHRDRMGQMFVLPGFQRKGVGLKMMEAIQSIAQEQNAVDVSIEDPTDVMLAMKRTYDMERMLDCDWLKNWIQQQQECMGSAKGYTLLTKEQTGRIHTTLRIPLCEIELLWSALLLTDCIQQPDKTACIVQYLEHCWDAAQKEDVTQKLIFQELVDDGEHAPNFVMTKCQHHGICKVIDGIMVIPTESCPEEKQQRQTIVQQKLATALELASHFVHRHSQTPKHEC